MSRQPKEAGTLLPRLRKDLELVLLGDESAIYDGARGSVHVLNTTASVVAQCCDGRSTVDAVVQRLVMEFQGADSQTVTGDVAETVQKLRALGLLGHD